MDNGLTDKKLMIMTEIEKRFFAAAIAYFGHGGKSDFIEVTRMDIAFKQYKVTISKSSIDMLVPFESSMGYNAEITVNGAKIPVVETYEQIKAML